MSEAFNVAAYERQGLIAADTALQVTIIDANGEVLQTTTPDAQPVNLADRPHFIAHKINPDVVKRTNFGTYLPLNLRHLRFIAMGAPASFA